MKDKKDIGQQAPGQGDLNDVDQDVDNDDDDETRREDREDKGPGTTDAQPQR